MIIFWHWLTSFWKSYGRFYGPYFSICDVTNDCTWKSEPCRTGLEAIQQLDEHQALFNHLRHNREE